MYERLLRRLLELRIGAGAAVLLGLAAAAASASLRYALQPVLSDEGAFTLNFLAIAAAAFTGGAAGGFASVAAGGLFTFYFFFDPPMHWVRTSSDIFALGLFWLTSGLIVLSVVGLRVTFRRLMRREQELLLATERERLLAREMGHRTKNLLAVVQGVVDQTLRGAEAADARERLTSRLKALGAAQEVALHPLEDVRLAKVVEAALAPLGDERIDRDVPSWPEVDARTASGVLLALHELATNALKYGALSAPGGRVSIQAEPEGPGGLRLIWRETGGPPVRAPDRRGFGSRLVARAVAGPDQGVALAFPPDGVECVFRLKIAGRDAAAGRAPAGRGFA
jgi:two-component sensor histidine kinase